jgi:hypothetical protein
LTLAISSIDPFRVSLRGFGIPLFFAEERRLANKSAGDAPVGAVIEGFEKRSG